MTVHVQCLPLHHHATHSECAAVQEVFCDLSAYLQMLLALFVDGYLFIFQGQFRITLSETRGALILAMVATCM